MALSLLKQEDAQKNLQEADILVYLTSFLELFTLVYLTSHFWNLFL